MITISRLEECPHLSCRPNCSNALFLKYTRIFMPAAVAIATIDTWVMQVLSTKPLQPSEARTFPSDQGSSYSWTRHFNVKTHTIEHTGHPIKIHLYAPGVQIFPVSLIILVQDHHALLPSSDVNLVYWTCTAKGSAYLWNHSYH